LVAVREIKGVLVVEENIYKGGNEQLEGWIGLRMDGAVTDSVPLAEQAIVPDDLLASCQALVPRYEDYLAKITPALAS
jgi:hypothetical protein